MPKLTPSRSFKSNPPGGLEVVVMVGLDSGRTGASAWVVALESAMNVPVINVPVKRTIPAALDLRRGPGVTAASGG